MAKTASRQPEQGGGPSRTSLFLVGFMGAGKTSVGQLLARKLRWRFIDLDDRVEAREGRTIAEIFSELGEEAFRTAESAALSELLNELSGGDPAVVALGGGAYVQAHNANAIRASKCKVIFLDAAVDELRRRCEAKGAVRPLFQDQQRFTELYHTRRQHYRKADLHVETTGLSVYAVARQIISLLGIEKR